MRKAPGLSDKSRMLYYRILTNGIRETGNYLHKRNIIITNALATVFIAATLLMYGFVWFKIPYLRPVSWFFIIMIVSFAIPLLLNRLGHHRTARFMLASAPPVLTIVFSVLSKMTIESFTFNDYHNFRIALIVFCTLPFFLFSLAEKRKLTASFILNFSCLALTDVVHHLFNVGYYDIGFEDTHYGFINFFSLVAAFPIVFGVLFFKGIIEKQNAKNEALVARLKKSNWKNIQQNHILQDQKERLELSERELKKANDTIVKQKYLLEEELAMYDHEVAQFSYNVCHHLRGPAASLIGLVSLLEEHPYDSTLIPHFRSSVNRLNQVIIDLNDTLNIRRDLFRVKTQVRIADALAEAIELLNDDLQHTGSKVNIALETTAKIFAPKSSIVNILFNLISNSIKYRDTSRKLVIDIKSHHNGLEHFLEITDNGLGIDLERYGNDLFKMYKRFHLHTDGKGLGLYLVKLQVMALGGKITAKSKVGGFTTFTISFHESGSPELEAYQYHTLSLN